MEKVIKQEILETKFYLTKVFTCVDQNSKKPYYMVYQKCKNFDNRFYFINKFDNHEDVLKIIW